MTREQPNGGKTTRKDLHDGHIQYLPRDHLFNVSEIQRRRDSINSQIMRFVRPWPKWDVKRLPSIAGRETGKEAIGSG